jgi:hypothetical protein
MGGYEGLSDATRVRLTERLRSNLEALNRALDPPAAPPPSTDDSADPSLLARVRRVLGRLW